MEVLKAEEAKDEKCKEVLKALDIALMKQFEKVPSQLVQYIDVNINDFIKWLVPEEIGVLSSKGMVALLEFVDGSAKEIDLLSFFVEWKKSHWDTDIDISKYVELGKLNADELKIARKSKLFPVDDITDNFERIVAEQDLSITEKDAKIAEKEKLISEKEKILLNLEKSSMAKDKLLQVREKTITSKNTEIKKLKCSTCQKNRKCYVNH